MDDNMKKFNESENNNEVVKENNDNSVFENPPSEPLFTGPAQPVERSEIKRLKIFMAIFLVLLILITAASAFTLWNLSKTKTKVSTVVNFLDAQNGTDLEAIIDNGLSPNKHPIYDNTAVLNAYKTGDASKLSEKDKFVYETAKATIEEVITDDMTDYEKELAIYDWLFSQTHYNNDNFVDVVPYSASEEEMTQERKPFVKAERSIDQSNENEDDSFPNPEDDKIAAQDPFKEYYDYEPYGVLKFGEYICIGNATTFKLFMDMLDIPCKIIHSTEEGEHAWNLVKIGGAWYHLDITFDNGGSTPTYSNFNVTDNMKLTTYPWDTTEFPAANSTKYSYASQNSIAVKDIYALPNEVRKALDEDTEYLYVHSDDNSALSFSAIDTIMSYLYDAYPNGAFYIEEIPLTEDKTYYMLQLTKEDSFQDDYRSDDWPVEIDYDKLYDIMYNVFGDLIEAVG